ncbi:MerR family transcriptional regulator [Serinicoccus kebangsaanensis]|uniref:MerR family transcriptional regulator n=1 Tax=Serinicoccus kebangsaanensis TaxID=2602069 RepID=UPI00124C6AB4|nr:MerR family transcriptional regulator [Serinicoccus kebangsaanensis]
MRTIEVARAAGCSVQQVRKLEALGVLPPVPRTSSGYRRYAPAHLSCVLAYAALAAAVGPSGARDLMQTLHTDVGRFLTRLDLAHARLASDRADLDEVSQAMRAIGADPVGDAVAADDLSVGELALAIGVRGSTLRHWEAEGLLHPGRAEAMRGARRYGPAAVRDARLVQQLRLAGYGIPAVRSLLPRLQHEVDAADALTRRREALAARSRALVRAAAHLHPVLG